MSQTVTLTLPDSFIEPLLRTAEAVNQPVEEVLLTALQASLPPLDGLSDDFIDDLTALERLDDQSLWRVMGEHVSPDAQQELTTLLQNQQAGSLNAEEVERLASLQRQADLLMLRKARAAALLRFRGRRIPTLAELEQLSEQAA